ncbi:Mif2/CENP-C like-domain-containing protein [Annulohypoxylon truncatum]|uniref:Mif2/CENP-C like-domain-containing protein n=1 Tax=Annulohypoxylon truncatum TaxID=327061 RepID=UPI002007423F|nr:Mif2/CENP-C like-domain-containing protein [Annulohypoxylon truncatum]KAI1210660.1 Mif2/CENP-C like-domain-containing protein [Annulohypoxylon truncatum]
MPPKQSSQRRITQSQHEGVYELGKQGRKTGITLEERERDEHGFENVDALFSSPEKDVNNVTANGTNRRGRDESDEEQTMEIDDESQMGPATIMKQRYNRPSLPRARSPLKTNLQSPARQNPHLGPTSSPTRGSIVPAPEHSSPRAVNRRLDFSQGPSQSRMRPPVNGASKVNGTKARTGKLTNGHARAQESDEDDDAILRGRRNQPREEEEEEEEEEPEEDMQGIDAGDDMDLVEEEQDDAPIEPEPEPEPEEEEEEPIPPAKKRRGRKPKSPVVQEEEGESSMASAQSQEAEAEPVKKKQRGRPAKGAQSKQSPEAAKQPAKQPAKRRRSDRNSGSSNSNVEEQGEEEQEDNVEERETKRQRSDKKEDKAASSKSTATKQKGKPGRKRKSSGIGVDQPVVQRGPPLPKGRGLVTLHREEEDNMRTTRSGRHSYKPVAFWRGEQVKYDIGENDIFEDKKQRFVIPSVAGIIRKTEVENEPRKRRPGRPSKLAKKGRPSAIIEEDVERDDWEYDPGRVAGECIFWRPDQENQPDDGELEVAEEELAISEAAIQLKDIKDATFRFAKTLTMPFFGSGIVDMPPGSEKRTKNSRKMQMVFFVHAGSVEVTVAQTEFRIGKGGMWFVPRGNHYSILNNSSIPARIFFAQGCEMVAQPEGFEGTQE